MAPNINHDGPGPPSPDTQAYIDNYTPSKEPQSTQDFIGRYQLRRLNGQDPEQNPEKFTPIEDQRMKWPTDKEAYAWAEAAKENSRKRPLSAPWSARSRRRRAVPRAARARRKPTRLLLLLLPAAPTLALPCHWSFEPTAEGGERRGEGERARRERGRAVRVPCGAWAGPDRRGGLCSGPQSLKVSSRLHFTLKAL